MPNLAHFPDLCLLHIFDQLYLEDLLAIHRVCTQWKALQKAALARRKKLSIYLSAHLHQPNLDYPLIGKSPWTLPYLDVNPHGLPSPPQAKNHFLCFASLTDITLSHLLTTYTAITHLQFAINLPNPEHLPQQTAHLEALLHALSPQLQSLKLYLNYRPYHEEPADIQANSLYRKTHLTRLLNLINHMPVLSSLWLDIHHSFADPSLHWPILGQLRHFHFHSTDPADILFASLLKYPSTQLESLSIANQTHTTDAHTFSKIAIKLGPKFRHFTRQFPLPHTNYLLNKTPLSSFPFTSLVDLSLCSENAPYKSLVQLAHLLSPLNSLLYLNLSTGFTRDPNLQMAPFPSEDVLPSEQIPSLPSVRVLKLDTFKVTTHTDLHSRHLGTILPNLTTLEVIPNLFTCSACLYNDFYFVPLQTKRRCAVALFSPWFTLTKLQSLYLYTCNDEPENGHFTIIQKTDLQ